MNSRKLLLLFILLLLTAACLTLTSCYEEWTDVSAELLQIEGAEISDYSTEITVDNETYYINFGDKITCPDRYEWKLFDGYGYELTNKTAPIMDNGYNYFIVKLFYNGTATEHVYTVKVFRNYYAYIRYYVNDDLLSSEEAMTNTLYNVSTTIVPSKNGYEFVCWTDYDGNTVTQLTPTHSVRLYAAETRCPTALCP